MFGDKKEKQTRLQREVQVIRQRGEVTQIELAREMGVSVDAIADDLTTLSEQRVPLCQKGQKISHAEYWYRNKKR